jgi:MFS family permease
MMSFVNFAPLLPMVRDELLLSNTWASMPVAMTMLAHMLCQMPAGQVTASIGAKRTIGLGMTTIGASLMASGFAPSFPLLLLFRFILGVGTALAFISGLALVAGLTPLRWRVQVQGLYGASGNFGIVMALLFSERLASLVGWRGSFVLEGIFVLLLATVATVWLPKTTPASRLASAPWGQLLRERALYLLGLGHVFTYGVFIGIGTWAATYLWDTHGVDLAWAGPLAAVLAVSAVVGRLFGGIIARGRERPVILAGVFGTAVMTAALPLAPNAAVAILMLLALGWFASMPFGALFFYISLLSERLASARGLSLINFVANIGAFAFPPLVGYALDLSGTFLLGFGILAALGLAGLATLATQLPRPIRVSG